MIKTFEKYISLNEKIEFQKIGDITRTFMDFQIGHWYRVKRGNYHKIGNRDVFIDRFSKTIRLDGYNIDWGCHVLYYNKEYKNGKIIKPKVKDDYPYTYMDYFSFYEDQLGYSVSIEKLERIIPKNMVNVDIDPYGEEEWEDD